MYGRDGFGYAAIFLQAVLLVETVASAKVATVFVAAMAKRPRKKPRKQRTQPPCETVAGDASWQET